MRRYLAPSTALKGKELSLCTGLKDGTRPTKDEAGDRLIQKPFSRQVEDVYRSPVSLQSAGEIRHL
jgi:hypothetical protein